MICAAKQNGYILLPVVIVITLVAAIALLMNTESALESNTAATELDAQRAQYVTAAGLNHAQWLARQQGCGPYTNLTTQTLGNDSYSASLTTDLGTTTAYSAGVDQDDGIVSSLPDANNGGSVSINIAYNGVDEERMLTRFDLTAIPANSGIVSAQARFYVEVGHAAGAIDLHQVVSDWSESDATWNTMNDRFAAAVFASIPPQAVSGVWVSVNITSLVQAWVNGEPNYGVMLKSATPNINARYSSRESANPPALEVIVGTPPSSPATLSATGTLSNGVSRQLLRDDIELVQQPGYLQLQPGPAAGKDNYLYEWKSTWNYGISNRIWVDERFNDSSANGLIHFDLAAVPAGARVISARLELYQANTSIDGGPIGIYRVVADWEEGTNSGGIGTANWTQRDAGNSWLNAGADFGTTRYALETVPSGLGWSSWEIGELVDGWVAGNYPNHGLALYAESPGDAAHFASSDDTDPTLRPKLSITYACACDRVCLAPQGSGNLLMVVVNPTTLVPSDANKKALFESWGFIVSVISESANQASYDTLIAVNDVVFISETVNSIQVGSKLVNAPIGVVSQDGSYNDDLGFAASSAWTVGSAIDIISTDHYITRPFIAGPVQIYLAGMEQLTVAGLESADLQVLAQSSGVGSLVALDSGDTLENGGTAAGRRVMLPLGREAGFDWDHLSSDGLLLVQRALTWGAGLEAVNLNPQLLLVVVDPASLTVQESAKKTLIEGWGYDVNLIDESDTQTSFDTALAANDVVFITEDVTSSSVNTKLVAATIGVVTEEVNLSDEFGFSSHVEWSSGTVINIKDPPHYITQPFGKVTLTVLTVSESLAFTVENQAPDLLRLGASNEGSILVALETGAALQAGVGGNAAGRRVQLPWGGNTFDVNHLNADGLTIMQRAIEWSAGADASGATGPIAHWKLDEGSGLAVIDSVGGNDATLNGDATWTTGRIDGALDFDGSGDYATTDNNFTPPPVGTVTFWLQVPGAPTSRSRVLGMADDWEIRHESGGSPDAPASSLAFDLGDGDTNQGFWTTVPIDQAGRWYHIAAVYDTSTEAYAVYIDGILDNSGTYPTDLAVPAAAPLSIGARTGSSQHFEGRLDDVRIYDRALSANEIATLYAEAPVILDAYEETYQPWAANNDDVWEVVDLAAFGVPPNAVVEVAVINEDSVRERSGGVRAVGSVLDRQFILHEAESGGSDVMVMHVQANAASQIEHYTEFSNKVSFILLGYWNSGSFVETWNNFEAAANFSWDSVALSGYGVPPGAIAEVLAYNDNNNAQFRGGVRTPGSTVERLINLHEAEGGGNEIATMLVTAGSDASATIEVYSESAGDVDFHLSGYWDNPPGVFTETFSEIAGLPASSSSWEDASLAAFGVPAKAIVSIMLANSQDSAEAQLGVRQKGSSLARTLGLQEAEPTGDDLGTMHALTDGSSIIQLYDENTTQDHRFYLMGWWQITP